MKKIFVLLISVFILLCLVACGNNDTTDNNSSTQSSQESTTSDIVIETKPTGDETNDIPPTIGNGNTNTEQGDNTSNDGKHVHTYKKATIKPTCEKDGFTSYSCDCGAQYTENTVAAKGHNFSDWTEKTPATESTAGKEERKCKNCDKVETRDIPKLIAGHTHSYTSSITKESTCQEEGVKTFTCSCGAKYTESIGVTPHNYKTETVKPTCTSAGYTKYTCSCGKSYYDDTIKPIAHNYTEVKTVATCTDGGYTTYTCKNCNYSYVGNNTKAKGHNYENKVTNPTCTSDGYTTHTCTVCGNTYKDNFTHSIEHNWEQATCNTPKKCKICGTTEGGANGHKWHNGKCEVCTTIMQQYTTEKFLDELEGVIFTYKGITYNGSSSSRYFTLVFSVTNNTNEVVCVQTRNDRVNGHQIDIDMSDYISPNSTQTVTVTIYANGPSFLQPLETYGEDIITYVEFNCYVAFMDRDKDKYFTSKKDILLYPYE